MGRKILGVSKRTTNEVIQGELGLTRISSRRIYLRLRFWEKLIRMKEKKQHTSRLVYKIYKQRRTDFIKEGKIDTKNWCYWTWTYLKGLHLEHAWESEQIPARSNFSKLVKSLIKKKEESEWRDRMNQKNKLRLYRKLKDRLILEDYVIDFDREERRELAMIRGGTNRLGIETGRWRRQQERDSV